MLSLIRKCIKIAGRVTGKGSAASDVPFEVTCECGATVTGQRRATWIEAECPSCLHSVFVLPANVYPRTKRVPSNVLGGSFFARLNAVIAEMRPAVQEPANKKPASGRPASKPAAAAAPRTKRSAILRQALQRRSVAVRRAASRALTPFRMIIVATVVAVALTGYWVVHQRAVEAAQETWITSRRDLDTLLQEGQLSELESALNDVVAAGTLLGKNDAEWRSLLNLRDETRAVNTIADKDLLTALRQAYDNDDKLVPGAQRIVEAAALSGTFVMDSYVQTGSAPGQFVVDLPAVPGIHSAELLIELPAIDHYLQQATDGRMAFAVAITTIEAPAKSDSGSWQLDADPASFVLLTNEVHCEQLGIALTDDEDLKQVVSRQRAFVEQSEAWAARSSSSSPDTDSEGDLQS